MASRKGGNSSKPSKKSCNKTKSSNSHTTHKSSNKNDDNKQPSPIPVSIVLSSESKSLPLTTIAVAVLVVVVGVFAPILWKQHQNHNDSAGTKTSQSNPLDELLKSACASTSSGKGFNCHNAIYADGRTLKVKQDIPQHEYLFEIPAAGYISDQQAAQDEWIQSHRLPKATHKLTKQSVGTKPLLSFYLAQLLTKKRAPSSDVQQRWLDYLPSYNDLASFHPCLQDPKVLEKQLGTTHSLAYNMVVRQRQDLFDSEYEAFHREMMDPNMTLEGNEYEYEHTIVSAQDFRYARVLQMSRYFFLPREPGVEITAAMTLLLDVFDHRHEPQDNVEYVFNKYTGTFRAKSKVPIHAGEQLAISYGNKTESALYAIYGFVMGDGLFSGASLAVYHELYLPEVGIPNQNSELVKYLLYDDGYSECIQEDLESVAARLKFFKLYALTFLAGDQTFWTIQHPFGDLTEDKLQPLLSLCRLIAMTDRDMNGRALFELQAHGNQLRARDLSALRFEVDKDNESWEFRSMVVLKRLALQAMALFGTNASAEEERRRIAASEMHSTEWNVAHVRLSELVTLQKLVDLAEKTLQLNRDKMLDPPSEDYHIRSQPCPNELSDFILKYAP